MIVYSVTLQKNNYMKIGLNNCNIHKKILNVVGCMMCIAVVARQDMSPPIIKKIQKTTSLKK